MANSKVALNATIDSKAYMKAMRVISKDAYPKAVAETLNDTAEAVTKQQIRNVKKDLIVRTKFTINSMQRRGGPINTARGKNVDRMFSRAGTFSQYLWLQEDDNEIEGIDGPKPIATLQARTSKSLHRTVRKAYRLKKSATLQPGAFGEDGKKFIGTPRGGNRRYGLYERTNNNKRLKMIRNLESDSVRIKGKHFHSNAVKRYGTQQYISAKFKKNAEKALRRKGVA